MGTFAKRYPTKTRKTKVGTFAKIYPTKVGTFVKNISIEGGNLVIQKTELLSQEGGNLEEHIQNKRMGIFPIEEPHR